MNWGCGSPLWLVGANHLAAPGTIAPIQVFHFRCIQAHRLFALRARLRGNPGDFRPDHPGRGFASTVSAGQGEAFMDSECVSCGACVKASPHRDTHRKTPSLSTASRNSVITTCALWRRLRLPAELKGTTVVRMTPHRDGKRQRGSRLRQGPLLATPPTDRITAHDTRQHRSALAQVSREEAIAIPHSAAPSSSRYGATASAPSVPRAAPTRRSTWCRSWCGPVSATTISTPALASATRRRAAARKRPWGTPPAPRPCLVAHTDVVLVMGLNPTEAHPVFGLA